jgi:hypothetical protein
MFYRVNQQPNAPGIRLSPKNPDRKYHPKWSIVGQSSEHVAVTTTVPYGTLGLHLSDSEAVFLPNRDGGVSVPCMFLLINDQRLYVPKQCVIPVTNEEIEKELNDDEQEQKT